MRVVISSGNLDELHLHPCSQRFSAATQLTSRKQQQLKSNSHLYKKCLPPKPLWAKPKAFSKTLQNHLQNGTKAERVSSKALAAVHP